MRFLTLLLVTAVTHSITFTSKLQAASTICFNELLGTWQSESQRPARSTRSTWTPIAATSNSTSTYRIATCPLRTASRPLSSSTRAMPYRPILSMSVLRKLPPPRAWSLSLIWGLGRRYMLDNAARKTLEDNTERWGREGSAWDKTEVGAGNGGYWRYCREVEYSLQASELKAYRHHQFIWVNFWKYGMGLSWLFIVLTSSPIVPDLRIETTSALQKNLVNTLFLNIIERSEE